MLLPISQEQKRRGELDHICSSTELVTPILGVNLEPVVIIEIICAFQLTICVKHSDVISELLLSVNRHANRYAAVVQHKLIGFANICL